MLETKILNLIDKHQSQADNYHRMAETFREHGLKEKSWEMDSKAHPHEAFSLELRMILKGDR